MLEIKTIRLERLEIEVKCLRLNKERKNLHTWPGTVELLESTVSPLLKVAMHWMLVLLCSADTLLKTNTPCLDS